MNRSDPIRPFISGHVANSMAAEVIALLHSLLTAPESNTAQIWTSTAEKVSIRRMTLSQVSYCSESPTSLGNQPENVLAMPLCFVGFMLLFLTLLPSLW